MKISLIIISTLTVLSTFQARASEGDLKLFNMLTTAGGRPDHYDEPRQVNLIADALLCMVNVRTKAYHCEFTNGAIDPDGPIGDANVEFAGPDAQSVYNDLVSRGFKVKDFPGGYIVSAASATCIQTSEDGDQRSLAERTDCDFIR